MKVFIRIETVNSPKSNLFTEESIKLEQAINLLTEDGSFGGESIENEFHTVIRIYPKKTFDLYSEYYKPVAKFSKAKKAVLFTYDLCLEDLEKKDNGQIFEEFKIGVIESLRKLNSLKINDVNVEALGQEIEKL